MITLLAVGGLIAIDNLRVSLALGFAPMPKGTRSAYALAFGLFEATAVLVGVMWGHVLVPLLGDWGEYLGAGALAGVGALLLIERDNDRLTEERLGRPWMVIAMPAALSIDNLLAGIGLGLLEAPVVVVAGVAGGVSSLAAALGLYAGALFRERIRALSGQFTGVILIGSAVLTAVF